MSRLLHWRGGATQLRRAGFTLVELVIVIAVIGILAAVAIPQFIDIRSEAYIAQRDGIATAVRSGVLIAATKNQVGVTQEATVFPPNLEVTWGGLTGGIQNVVATLCSADPCFELVLSTPVSDSRWEQTTATTYTFTPPVGAAKVYTYTGGGTGTFE